MRVEDLFFAAIDEQAFVWSTSLGIGTYLTMEFGQPHLTVREPMTARMGATERVRDLLSRRKVSIVGDWTLWIQEADWLVCQSGRCVGVNDPDLRTFLDCLNGQRLMNARFDEHLELEFDLGASVRLSPSVSKQDDIALWSLTYFKGTTFTLHGSVRFQRMKLLRTELTKFS